MRIIFSLCNMDVFSFRIFSYLVVGHECVLRCREIELKSVRSNAKRLNILIRHINTYTFMFDNVCLIYGS